MFISLEFLAVFSCIYFLILGLIWREFNSLSKYTERLQKKLVKLKGESLFFKNHNELLKTRIDIISGHQSTDLFDGEDTNTDLEKTTPSYESPKTLHSLAEDITSIKKMLDQKLGGF